MVENAVAFTVNEQLKRMFPRPSNLVGVNGNPPVFNFGEDILKPMGIGFITGTCSAIVLIPSEVIKTKTQVSTTPNVSSWTITKDIIRRQGVVRGLFNGMDAQIMRDAPFYACFFGGYEALVRTGKHFFPSVNEEVIFFMSGGFAGMFSWAVAMPFDVPKTIVQSSYKTGFVGDYFPAMASIIRSKGSAGLYAGLMPTLVRAFPANAALFLGVELAKKGFDDVFQQ